MIKQELVYVGLPIIFLNDFRLASSNFYLYTCRLNYIIPTPPTPPWTPPDSTQQSA
mgnify:CR=1 FL=1